MSDRPERAEIVRTAVDLQRAHDILASVVCIKDLRDALLAKANDPEPITTQKCMKAALDVLCWALGHENGNFEHNLRALEAAIAELGLVLSDAGELMDFDEWLEKNDGPLPS